MTFGDNKLLFPFNNCNNNELINVNNSNICSSNDVYLISTLPKHIITEQAIKVSNLNSQDNDDINLSNLSSCKYYSCSNFHKQISIVSCMVGVAMYSIMLQFILTANFHY